MFHHDDARVLQGRTRRSPLVAGVRDEGGVSTCLCGRNNVGGSTESIKEIAAASTTNEVMYILRRSNTNKPVRSLRDDVVYSTWARAGALCLLSCALECCLVVRPCVVCVVRG